MDDPTGFIRQAMPSAATLAYLQPSPGCHRHLDDESKTNFVGSVTSGRVRAVSRALHIGRSTIVVETEVRDAGYRLVAKTTQTQAVLWPRNSAAAETL